MQLKKPVPEPLPEPTKPCVFYLSCHACRAYLQTIPQISELPKLSEHVLKIREHLMISHSFDVLNSHKDTPILHADFNTIQSACDILTKFYIGQLSFICKTHNSSSLSKFQKIDYMILLNWINAHPDGKELGALYMGAIRYFSSLEEPELYFVHQILLGDYHIYDGQEKTCLGEAIRRAKIIIRHMNAKYLKPYKYLKLAKPGTANIQLIEEEAENITDEDMRDKLLDLLENSPIIYASLGDYPDKMVLGRTVIGPTVIINRAVLRDGLWFYKSGFDICEFQVSQIVVVILHELAHVERMVYGSDKIWLLRTPPAYQPEGLPRPEAGAFWESWVFNKLYGPEFAEYVLTGQKEMIIQLGKVENWFKGTLSEYILVKAVKPKAGEANNKGEDKKTEAVTKGIEERKEISESETGGKKTVETMGKGAELETEGDSGCGCTLEFYTPKKKQSVVVWDSYWDNTTELVEKFLQERRKWTSPQQLTSFTTHISFQRCQRGK
eukprot:TRINITY_DN26680_c0_g3_i1.p1 TRINITY_DN26680_c0_g3~~TRINITY_DN26680_c0_g3_i1.p1  ORF type:complete len:511 (+),score=36.12 TRINITY_DN26680_c0_g3_i1:46-1533(+)